MTLPSGSSGGNFVKVQVLLPAPAASCRSRSSGGDSKDPNLITRRWGSDLSLLTTPAASCRPQSSGGDSKDPNLITRWWGSDLSLLTAPNKHRNYDTKAYRKSGACFFIQKPWFIRLFLAFKGEISVRIKIIKILSTEFFRTWTSKSYGYYLFWNLTKDKCRSVKLLEKSQNLWYNYYTQHQKSFALWRKEGEEWYEVEIFLR